MSNSEDEQSPNPRFWLEFRIFDDGLSPVDKDTLKPPFNSYPQFVRLPTELRLKIWSYLVQPRIVVVSCLQREDDDGEQDEQEQQQQQRRRQQHQYLCDRSRGRCTPPLLHINREARDVGLRHYEPTFSWRISKMLSDTPTWGPARTWFNFALDALYLTGELEAFDAYGFNAPMVYFLRREDAARVRHVACPFAQLGYPEQGNDQVFGCLWHVADRFPVPARLLLTVREGDEEAMRRGERMPGVDVGGGGCRGGGGGVVVRPEDNVVQKIWRGWMRGTTVTSSRMADKQMLLVREENLAEVIASSSRE